MGQLIVDIINGLAFGSMYALMALAIGITYSTTSVSNFAHGSVVMFGAMSTCHLIIRLRMPLPLAILCAIVISVLVNGLLYFCCIRPLGELKGKPGWIITTLAANILLTNVARLIFGYESQPVPYVKLFGIERIRLFGIQVYVHELVLIAITVILGVGYTILLKKTRFGRSVRAVAYSPSTARLMGIKSTQVMLACFAMSGAVAAIAGSLIAPYTFAIYSMTDSIGLKGFAAAVIGGMGNTLGAFTGGFALGLVEKAASYAVTGALKDAVSFALMIIVLLLLPGGIFSAVKKRHN